MKRWLRGPLHPLTVHMPIGLLIGATAALVAAQYFTQEIVADGATVMLIGGLATTVPAIISGMIELAKQQGLRQDAAGKIADRHLMAVIISICLYAMAAWAHLIDARVAALVLALAGAVILMIGGHLGATLVYDHGIGPHPTMPTDEVPQHPE